MASVYRIPHADKIAHFLLMGLLAFFVALAAAEHRVHRWLFLLSAVITLEEFSQMFIATRNFSWIDLLFSLLGVVCFGWWGARLAKPKSC